MKKLLIVASAGIAAWSGGIAAPSVMAQASNQAQVDVTPADRAREADKSYLLVLSAKSGQLKDGKLVLHGTSNLVGWFTDRPYRETGSFPLEHLTAAWTTGADSLEADPPNAVLVAEGHETDPTIVELTDLVVEANTVTFSVKRLEGPGASPEGAVTLIVDDGIEIKYCGIFNCFCLADCPI